MIPREVGISNGNFFLKIDALTQDYQIRYIDLTCRIFRIDSSVFVRGFFFMLEWNISNRASSYERHYLLSTFMRITKSSYSWNARRPNTPHPFKDHHSLINPIPETLQFHSYSSLNFASRQILHIKYRSCNRMFKVRSRLSCESICRVYEAFS